ncbi:MAG: ATP-binding protein, partial [Marinobacter sp.]
MTRSQEELFATEILPFSAFILTHLDLYNWGPFGGRHCAEIDSKGTAIIGPTGSGKTTLVDALMTLLTHQPRYNLASTGG